MGTISGEGTWIAKGVHRQVWKTLTSGNLTGSAMTAPMLPDKTVQVVGTFGSSGAVVIEGSNNTATGPYHTLNDSRGEGNALSLTAADTRIILENPLYIRPRLTNAGAGSAWNIDVRVIAQSTRR